VSLRVPGTIHGREKASAPFQVAEKLALLGNFERLTERVEQGRNALRLARITGTLVDFNRELAHNVNYVLYCFGWRELLSFVGVEDRSAGAAALLVFPGLVGVAVEVAELRASHAGAGAGVATFSLRRALGRRHSSSGFGGSN
jgi:hypothetical protein